MPSRSFEEEEERGRLYNDRDGYDMDDRYSSPVARRQRPSSSIWRRPTPYLIGMIILLVGYVATHRENSTHSRDAMPEPQIGLGEAPPYDPTYDAAHRPSDPVPVNADHNGAGHELDDIMDNTPDKVKGDVNEDIDEDVQKDVKHNTKQQNTKAATPVNAPDKAVVLSSYKAQGVKWMSNIPDDWQIYRYIMDDASLPDPDLSLHPTNATNTSSNNTHTYTVPRNQGREVMAYLTFIIDNYDNLPLFTVFLHGHDRAWHQIEHAADKIRALNLTAVAKDGYNTIRCGNHNRCDENKICDLTKGVDGVPFDHGRKLLPKFWELIFPHEPLPNRLAATQGAQFAVTCETIRSRPLSFWQSLRRPLQRDMPEYAHQMPGIGENGGYQFGLLFEHVWHVLFGKEQFHCPDIEYCRNEVFCGAITCDRYVDLKEETEGWETVGCKVHEEAMAAAKQEQDKAVKEARRRSGLKDFEP